MARRLIAAALDDGHLHPSEAPSPQCETLAHCTGERGVQPKLGATYDAFGIGIRPLCNHFIHFTHTNKALS